MLKLNIKPNYKRRSEMKLKDYIHYYYGCEFIANGMRYTIDRIDRLIKGTRQNPFGREVWNDFEPHKIKLVLRRLEDLTEEEAKQLAMIYSGAKSVERTKGVANNWHYYFCYFGENEEGELLIIAADGCAWYAHYFDKDQPGHRNIVNEHKAFHYLLQQGFGLFGLIDAGLAVDGKGLNETIPGS